MAKKKKPIYRYLPVIGGSQLIHPTAWWRFKTSDGIFPYKYGLGSFHYVGGVTRDDFRLPDDFYYFGDSGGFSVVTLGATINPVDCYTWQHANCDVGVILDMPPYESTGTAQFGGNAARIFHPRLERTCRNIEKVIKSPIYKKKSKFQWWGVIQGETHKQREMWYKAISSLHKFTGYALSPKPSYSWFEIVSHLLFAHKMKIKKIHILQISSTNTISLVMYVNKRLGDWFEFVTYDSSTPTKMAANGDYFVFDEENIKLNKVSARKSSPMCDCEMCQMFDFTSKHWCQLPNVLLRANHTIRSIIQLSQFLEKLDHHKLFDLLLKSNKQKEFMDCIRLIEHYLKTGQLIEIKDSNNYINKGFASLIK